MNVLLDKGDESRMRDSSEMHRKVHEEVDAEEVPAVTDTQCGYFWWKPACLQRLARPSIFLLVMCLYVGTDGLNVGIITGTITPMEARFQFNLTEMGSLQTSLSVGGMIGLLLVMYLGSRPDCSKPRLMGVCGILCSVGVLIQCLPQFIQGPYKTPGGISKVHDAVGAGPRITCGAAPGEVCRGDTPTDSLPENKVAYWVLVTGSVLQGLVIFGVYPLGVAYLADCTSRGTTSLYIGIINTILGLGPVLGVMLVAASISLWVDFYRLKSGTELALSPDDPGWVGAWWLGYLVSGILYCILSPLFLLFPRRMPEKPLSDRPQDYQELQGKMSIAGDHGEIEEAEHHMLLNTKDFLSEVWMTLKNPYCSLTCVSQSTFYFIMYGYGIFIPKYLEVQFGYQRRTADLFTGVLLAPAYAFGEFLAGFLVKKLDLKLPGIIRLSCCMLVLFSVGLAIIMFIGCDNDNVVGVFSSYDGRSSSQTTVGLEDPCNQNCSCSMTVYAPVCSGEGLTYFSPCHAGCTEASDNNSFSDCACLAKVHSLANQSTDGELDSVVEGACGTQCMAAIPFLVILTVVLVFGTFSDLLRLTIIVRSSTSGNRLVALSLAYLSQIIGVVPAGLVFGSLIDSSCVEWQQSCQTDVGACLLYDIQSFRLAYNGMALGMAIFSAAVMFIVLYLPKGKLNTLLEE